LLLPGKLCDRLLRIHLYAAAGQLREVERDDRVVGNPIQQQPQDIPRVQVHQEGGGLIVGRRMLLDPIERKVLKLAGIPLELVLHASRGAAVSRLLGPLRHRRRQAAPGPLSTEASRLPALPHLPRRRLVTV